MRRKVIITRRTFRIRRRQIKIKITRGQISKTRGKLMIMRWRMRRARIVKISRKTFERKVQILKKRVATKKISQKRYQ